MKVLYVERQPNEYVSIEKVFRQIASSLSPQFRTDFQQLPFGLGLFDTIRNLLFFRKKPADIYHITGHVNYIAMLFSPANTVLTFHDLRFIYEKRSLRRVVLKTLYLDLPVKKLKYITAVSEHTRREIMENVKCDPNKIRVIDLPVMDSTHPGKAKEFNKTRPVLLQVGTMPNKNIERLADAVSGFECRLRIIGILSPSQRDHLETAGIEYENVFGLDDEQMRAEYKMSDIVTFCSTFEGFGLPIIEAQAAGKPLITSNLSPMTETSGGAAQLVDPFSVESIRTGIKRIIDDDRYREELVDAGLKNAKRFRIENVIPKYEQLYEEIARNIAGEAS